MSCASRLLSAFSGVQAAVCGAGRCCGVAESSGWGAVLVLDVGGVEGSGGLEGAEGAAGCVSVWGWTHWIWPLALRTMTGAVGFRDVYQDICVNWPLAGLALEVEAAAVVEVAGTETAVDGAGADTAGVTDDEELAVD